MSFLLEPFTLLAGDFSLRHPAFAKLYVDPIRQDIIIEKLVEIDNTLRNVPNGFHYQRIYETTYRLAKEADVFIRESGYVDEDEAHRVLFEVNGVTELALWQSRREVFCDIPSKQVKKLITGSGNADKDEVAAGLARFFGPREYASTDQSDAVAIGVSWLMLSGILEECGGYFHLNREVSNNRPVIRDSLRLLQRNLRGKEMQRENRSQLRPAFSYIGR